MNIIDKEYTIDTDILALNRAAEEISKRISERIFAIEDEQQNATDGVDPELEDELIRLYAKADAIEYVLHDLADFI